MSYQYSDWTGCIADQSARLLNTRIGGVVSKINRLVLCLGFSFFGNDFELQRLSLLTYERLYVLLVLF